MKNKRKEKMLNNSADKTAIWQYVSSIIDRGGPSLDLSDPCIRAVADHNDLHDRYLDLESQKFRCLSIINKQGTPVAEFMIDDRETFTTILAEQAEIREKKTQIENYILKISPIVEKAAFESGCVAVTPSGLEKHRDQLISKVVRLQSRSKDRLISLLKSSRRLSPEEAAADPGFLAFKAEIDENVKILEEILAKLNGNMENYRKLVQE